MKPCACCKKMKPVTELIPTFENVLICRKCNRLISGYTGLLTQRLLRGEQTK